MNMPNAPAGGAVPPLKWTGVQMTRWSINQADRSGDRNLWLRTLDRLGLGFDS